PTGTARTAGSRPDASGAASRAGRPAGSDATLARGSPARRGPVGRRGRYAGAKPRRLHLAGPVGASSVVDAGAAAPAEAAADAAGSPDRPGRREGGAVEGVAARVEARPTDRALDGRALRRHTAHQAVADPGRAEADDRVRLRDGEEPGRLLSLLARLLGRHE